MNKLLKRIRQSVQTVLLNIYILVFFKEDFTFYNRQSHQKYWFITKTLLCTCFWSIVKYIQVTVWSTKDFAGWEWWGGRSLFEFVFWRVSCKAIVGIVKNIVIHLKCTNAMWIIFVIKSLCPWLLKN